MKNYFKNQLLTQFQNVTVFSTGQAQLVAINSKS